jgi:hypothetical protein
MSECGAKVNSRLSMYNSSYPEALNGPSIAGFQGGRSPYFIGGESLNRRDILGLKTRLISALNPPRVPALILSILPVILLGLERSSVRLVVRTIEHRIRRRHGYLAGLDMTAGIHICFAHGSLAPIHNSAPIYARLFPNI